MVSRVDSLPALLRFIAEQTEKALNTCLPGHIMSYDAATRRAIVLPALDALTADGERLPPPEIADVPVLFSSAGGYTLTLPVMPGDPVLLVFAQRGLSGFKREHGHSVPDADRLLSLPDAIAIPGFGPPAVTPVSLTGVALQSNDGQHSIVIDDTGVAINTSGALRLESASLTHNGVNIGATHTHRYTDRHPGGTDHKDTGGPQ